MQPTLKHNHARYNSFGEVLTMTDPLGHVTTNAYDSHGNLTSVTSPAPGSGTSASVTQFAYNSLGELTQIQLNRLSTLANSWAGSFGFSYDALSRRTQTIHPAYFL